MRTASSEVYNGHSEDVSMFDMFETNFLSISFACAKLVDHVNQASDLGTFSSISMEKQKKVVMHLLQKEVVFFFYAEAIWNSSAVAPSHA